MKNTFKNSAISDVLRHCREACGMSQQQVADILKIDRSTYTYYELGNTTPSAPMIVRLSKIFNVPYSKFMEVFAEDSAELALGDPASSEEDKNHALISAKLSVEPIYSLSKDEQTIVCLYRLLSKEKKKMLTDEARALSDDD